MQYSLLTTQDKHIVSNYGKDILHKANLASSKDFNSDKLLVFGQASESIKQLIDYIDHYSNDKKWIDNIPFFGKALKDNRYKSYTIDKAVDEFSKEIKNCASHIEACLSYSMEERRAITAVKNKVKEELSELSGLLASAKDTHAPRFALLEEKNMVSETYDTCITDDEYEELQTIKNNLSILQGTRAALALTESSLEAKRKMFSCIIDAAIKIQGKAKQCEVLPIILKNSLQAMKVSKSLAGASAHLDQTEHIVRALVSESANSVNHLTDTASQIKDIEINFKSIIEGLRELKTDVDSILAEDYAKNVQ